MAPVLFWTAGSLVLVITTISIVASLTTIHIMNKMNVWNGYVLLVYAVAVAQTFYDVSFYFLLGGSDEMGFCLYRAWNSASGVSVILWINVMSTLVFYTTLYMVSFRVKDYFYHMSCVIIALSLLMGIPDFITCLREPNDNQTNWIYYGIRLVSIFYNILVYIFITVLLHLPYSISLCHWTISDIGLRRKTNDLLVVLVRRLKYYPIVQVISRVAALIWDAQYGFGEYTWAQNKSVMEVVVQILYDITNPCAGIGYFLVFLWVQPSAYACFREMVAACTSCRCCCGSDSGTGDSGQRRPQSSATVVDTVINNPLTSSEFFASSVDHPMVLPHQPAHPLFPRFNSWVSTPNVSVEHHQQHSSRSSTRSTTTITAATATTATATSLSAADDEDRWDLNEEAIFAEIQRRTTIDDTSAAGAATGQRPPPSTRPSATTPIRGTADEVEAHLDGDANL